MTAWKNRVDLADLWVAFDEEKATIPQVAAAVAERLRALPPTDDLDEIIEEMEDLGRSNMAHGHDDWFDGLMDALWNYGDINAIWIDTMGVPA
jgi:hypothetical protein